MGFCWSFGFGGFLIKVEERFKGGGSEYEKYSRDSRASTEVRNCKDKVNDVTVK